MFRKCSHLSLITAWRSSNILSRRAFLTYCSYFSLPLRVGLPWSYQALIKSPYQLCQTTRESCDAVLLVSKYEVALIKN